MIKAFGIVMCIAALSATPSVSMALDDNTTSSSSTVTVRMHDLSFDPPSQTVTVGQTVVFQNNDGVAHNVTGSDMGTSGDIGAGKSWKYTFDKPGDYHYVCTYHAGMKGEITVTAAK